MDQIKHLLIKSNDTKNKLHESSLSSINTSSHMSINELCAELQLNWHIHSTRVTSNLHDVAMILNSITRSLAERHFKQGRLERDEGLSFLPETIRKGLSGCASRGRGPGKVPPMNNDTESLNSIDQEKTSHLWASRVWLAQLGQWRGLTGEIAHAITLVYPTARSFYVACKSAEIQSQKQVVLHLNSNPQVEPSSSSRSTNQKYIHPFEIELANLEIRRGAGVLSTRRRLGPEFARRLIKLFTSNNPYEIVN
ncbi:crossover junction endonuclease EME1 [Schistosoma japonicum]|nr:crossover junction endonuclease EME1 [Schistosoma japonicum]